LAHLLHLPTQVGVRWIHVVAQLGQAAPLPSVGWPVVTFALCGTAIVVARTRCVPRVGRPERGP
jgi:hypothetical protein